MAGRLTYTPEEAVDKLLSVYALVGDRKARTREEILGTVRESCGRASAVTVWIAEGLEGIGEEVWRADSRARRPALCGGDSLDSFRSSFQTSEAASGGQNPASHSIHRP